MTGPTRAELLREMRRALEAGGIENPALDARVLLLHALGIDAAALITAGETLVEQPAVTSARASLARRLEHEPVARILGEKEFFGLDFGLNEATLVPRPDTETVVELALEQLPDQEKPWRLLDLGTGTGAIAIALLSRLPRASALGVDLSPAAAAMARANAGRNGVGQRFSVIVGAWSAALAGTFDLIVSNPPYIPSGDIAGLDPDVRLHDPALALDGGGNGLDAYRAILGDAGRILAPDGVVVLELGQGQAPSVSQIAAQHGFAVIRLQADYGGVDRALALRKAP